jgi:competence protein ComEC
VPTTPAAWSIAAAVGAWLGAASGLGSVAAASLISALALVAVIRHRWVWLMLAFSVLGFLSGLASAARTQGISDAVLPSGRVEALIVIAEDATHASYGLAVAEVRGLWGSAWDGPRVAVRDLPDGIPVGTTAVVNGVVTPGVRRVRDEVVAGVLAVDVVLASEMSRNPLVTGGNLVRASVRTTYDGSRRADGLLSGFLTGDTDLMLTSDEENLRRSGLAHFVAVSGSNVAMFLAIWWFLTAPLSIRPRVRVVVGFAGLALFAVVTRWEPSVIRASVMAAVPLAGGWFGIPVDPWMALGSAVTVLVLVSGDLVASVGFQLSVAATAGVLVGLAMVKDRSPKWLWIPLLTTVGAQMAVAPIILSVFGTIPLAAPLTNLVAAPVVAGTTLVAAAGVVAPPLAVLARFGGGLVLWIAGVAAGGPQLGFVSTILAVIAAMLLVMRRSRPIALAVMILVGATMPWRSPWPEVPTVTVLDVGQGDAILLQTPDGSTLLVDGGSDPRILDRALRKHGVGSVDMAVLSHNDLDHAGGLVDLIAAGDVGTLFISRFGAAGDVRTAAEVGGVPVVDVERGYRFTLGPVSVEILSPHRRFASDNDGSVVLLLTAGLTMLLPADIEAVGQRELPDVRPDVIVVPHHGSATTDLNWLTTVVGTTAVLSYGPNTYGHPHPDVLAVLQETGAVVRSTGEEGDVSIPLTRVNR